MLTHLNTPHHKLASMSPLSMGRHANSTWTPMLEVFYIPSGASHTLSLYHFFEGPLLQHFYISAFSISSISYISHSRQQADILKSKTERRQARSGSGLINADCSAFVVVRSCHDSRQANTNLVLLGWHLVQPFLPVFPGVRLS